MATKTKQPSFGAFKPINRTAPPRLLARSWGYYGCGTTHFWASAPAPVLFFSFDKGLEGVVDKPEFKDKDIYELDYKWEPPAVSVKDEIDSETDEAFRQEAIDLRDRFSADFKQALEQAADQSGTVVLDKETWLWKLFRYAEFGLEAKDEPRNFPKLNQRYHALLSKAKSLPVNFGAIEEAKDKWGMNASGKLGNLGIPTPQGFDGLGGLVHQDFYHRVDGTDFIIDVGKARGPGSDDVRNQTMVPNITFTELAMLLFPDTDEDDWS